MPVSFHIDPASDRVVLIGTGKISGDEVIALLDEMFASPEVRGRNGFIDVSLATDASMTFDGVRRISDRVSKMEDLFRATRWAVVAPGDVMFGVARMYETLRAGGSFAVRTFRNASDAEAWLSAKDESL